MLRGFCPQCEGELVRVTQVGGWMSDEQFDAVKAGDWYFPVCPSNDRGQKPYCYWWNSEVQAFMASQCDKMMRN
jgi:hypothetical protein